MGRTVRRVTGPWTPAVHSLLVHLESVGFSTAPRAFGRDGQGREVLSYIEGETVGDLEPWPSWTRSDEALAQMGRLLRDYHRAVASFVPPVDARWRFSSEPLRSGQVVCHNDAAPYNVVWREGAVVGLIDWDVAGPGEPEMDLAFAAWQWVPLHHPAMLPALGWRDPPDVGPRLRLLCDSYELADRIGFAERIPARARASVERILRGAEEGDRDLASLRDRGYVTQMQGTVEHLEMIAPELQRALR